MASAVDHVHSGDEVTLKRGGLAVGAAHQCAKSRPSSEPKVALLRETRFSEASLLLHLDAKQLEGILAKRRLKLAGSK